MRKRTRWNTIGRNSIEKAESFGVRLVAVFVVAGLLTAAGPACSSAPEFRKPMDRIVPDRLRVRRPGVPPVDPKAGPGGVDYFSESPPDGTFDCREPGELFRDLDLEAVRECLGGTDEIATVRYSLFRHYLLELRLEASEKNPKCLSEVLPAIPVPREIFFVVNEPPKRPACHSARLAVEADKMLGVRFPGHQVVLPVRFPIQESLESREELIKLLTTWTFSLFFDTEKKGGQRILANPVPDAFCRRCFGKGDPLSFDGPAPPTWPAGK